MRILTSIAQKAVKYTTAQIKRTDTSAENQLVQNFFETMSPQASFGAYSREAQGEILNFVQLGNVRATSYIKNLVNSNADEKDILTLLREKDKLNLYCKIKSKLNKLLMDTAFGTPAEKDSFSVNLSLMGVKDETSYLNMVESNGFKEVFNGNLSAEYIKNIKSDDKIGFNYFYDLFANLEMATEARLSKIAGLDKEGVTALINSMDKEICKSPQVLEDLLVMLEKHKHPEIVNKITNIFEKDIKAGYYNDIKELIKYADSDPEVFSKVLKLREGLLPPHGFGVLEDIESLLSSDNKINKELLEFILKNKSVYGQFKLNDINNFLNIEGADEHLLKKYMDALNKMNKEKFIGYDLESVSVNNFQYFKKMLEENKINEENYFKLFLTGGHEIFKNSENWHLADKLYKETFLPILSSTDNLWAALDISCMRIVNPEIYNKLKTSGIIDLVISKKLKPDILSIGYGQEFIPEIYRDLELLKNGGSIIKRFTSFDKILSKTSPGDVVSVNGKMFINNNGRLEAWEMTEEKFNELFPLVERYVSSQGIADCFLFSALESIYRNPRTRGQYYKLFEQKGDDIVITIPAYKDFKGAVKFSGGEITTAKTSGRGAKHYLMVEQSYARTGLRLEKSTPVTKDSITTDDLDYLQKRLNGGQASDVIRDLLNMNPNLIRLQNNRNIAKGVVTLFFRQPNPEKAEKILSNYSNNYKYMFNLGIKMGRVYHAISVQSYNPKTGMLRIIDPTKTGVYEEKPLKELAPYIVKIWITSV